MEFDFEHIDRIVNARSLAIVGASNTPGKFGSFFTSAQLAMGFAGTVYLVNPGEREIAGQQAFPDLRSLPERPELVYVTIPADASLEVLRECVEVRPLAVIILAAGFRESGERGQALETEALGLARRGGFRIVGPNCFGIYNPRTRLTLVPGYDFSASPGGTAFLSQSGGLSAHVARLGRSLGIDFSAVISYGNGLDLDACDFLRYFGRDPRTDTIAGYLEGVGDGRGFLEALEEAAARKPVILWKVGRSEASRRAALSHTGSLAGAPEVWAAALRQRGVIGVAGVDEICDVLVALRRLGRTPGRRLLIVGGGGGLGTYASDLAEEEGLEVPPLEAGAGERIAGILRGAGAVAANPLDIGTPLIPLPAFEAVLQEAARNPTTDVLIFDLAVNFGLDLAGEDGMAAVAEVLGRVASESGKPLAAVLYTRSCDPDNLRAEAVLRRMRARLIAAGVAVFPSMRRAIRALSLITSRSAPGR